MNSEIIIPVPELKTALSGLNKIVGKKTTLPVLSHIRRVSRQKNGLVTLQATDLDAFATFTLNNSQPGEVVDVLVPLEQLTKASKCSDKNETVAVVCEDKATKLRYYIGGNPAHQPINSIPVAEWPSCPEITAESTPLQHGFGEALKQAMACCSQDQSRYILRGACLDARDKSAHYIVGTNGRFLYSANSFTFPMKDAVIIPDSKFINGSGLLDDESCFLAIQPVQVKKSEVKPAQTGKTDKSTPPTNLICLQSKQWQFVTREIEGQYPNWKQVIPTINSNWTLVRLNQPAIEQLLKVIPNLPGQDGADNKIKLRLGERDLWVEGRNKDDKESTSIAIQDVTIIGKAKEICLNRDYLLPALKFGLNELAILDELSPMVCSKDGKRMIIMPVRMQGPPTTTTPEPEPETSTKTPESTPATTSATTPPLPEVKPEAEERKTAMAKTTAKTAPVLTEATKPESSSKPTLIDQVEQIKETLKNTIRDLNSLIDAVKSAEKEQRASEREVEAARATLKKLQQVTI